jgi:hypothetical protein
MSAAALRWCAVPLGLLAFALRLANTLWWEPYTWRFSPIVGTLLSVGVLIVLVGILFGVFALLSRGYRPPAAFGVGESGFTVSPSVIFTSAQAIMWMFFGGGLIVTERVPNGNTMRLAEFSSGRVVSLLAVGVFVAVAAAFLVVRRPQLLLDSEGLTIRRLWSNTRLPWDELAPGGPLPPAKKQRQLQLFRKPPPNYPNYVPAEAIPVGRLDIDPAFLATAIRHYVEHPESRAAIGTVPAISQAG